MEVSRLNLYINSVLDRVYSWLYESYIKYRLAQRWHPKTLQKFYTI